VTTSPRPAVDTVTPAPVPAGGWITVQFVLSGLVWGASFLFMKVSLDGLSPAQVAWTRTLLGALTLGLIVLARRERHVPMPFGPYLALGGICALFWGPQISKFYLGA